MQRSSPSIASSLCQGEAVGQAVAPLAARIVARCRDLARGSPAVVLFVRSACAFLAGVMARRPPMRCLPALLLPGDLQMLNRLTARMLSLSRGHHRPASQPTEWARETRSASCAEQSGATSSGRELARVPGLVAAALGRSCCVQNATKGANMPRRCQTEWRSQEMTRSAGETLRRDCPSRALSPAPVLTSASPCFHRRSG